jgi:hypothetical protein
VIPSGVYCAPTGTITVNANGVSGEVTFVAQTIVLGGQHTTFTPHYQGLLAYQTGPAMVTIMSGNQVSLTGIIYAPDAEVELDGTARASSRASSKLTTSGRTGTTCISQAPAPG